MPIGPGKYDQLATDLRVAALAEGVAVFVIGGARGSGFSVQATPEASAEIPRILREVARQLERDVERLAKADGEV